MKLTLFKEIDFLNAVKALFHELKVPMNYVADEPTTAKEILKDTYKDNATFNLVDDVYFVGMVDDAAFDGNESLSADKIKSDYDGILIFGITLYQRENNLLPTRSQLAEISRAFNREFYYTPVVLVFKYRDNISEYLAFANTERLKYKQEWREGEKAGKVSLLRDIHIKKPHRGHEDIINQLKIPTSGTKQVDSFAKLYAYWQEVFSVSILNKKFYKELQNWYFWAIKEVSFPNQPKILDENIDGDETKLKEAIKEHKGKNVIRLLTRILFIWFIKEKKLIPEEIFDEETIADKLIDDFTPQKPHGVFATGKHNSKYYRAILQNLFFATLNQEMGKRTFRNDKQHQNVTNLMRYKSYFKEPDYFVQLMEDIVPFMNGGLFECLDKPHPDKKGRQGGDIIIYTDGFSDKADNFLEVPDFLFFDVDEDVDLSDDFGSAAKVYKNAKTRGLLEILKSYKFTITENTPIEEDVALDPELLGKVFENLLASYNPETKTTARKQTGSFYTPREIVNYMVDESLIAYLKSTVNFQFMDNTANLLFADIAGKPKHTALGTFFNPNDEIQIHKGNLPHWSQKDVLYFITFRLADSIPLEKQEQLKLERELWLKNHKKENSTNYTKEELKEYYRLFSERVEGWLNNGYGSCVLKDQKNANIVADALKYFEGERYELDEWVVMPNHVHVLVKPLGNHQISDILHSWKSFTANEINKNIGKTGQLWMHESYDHIVRNEKAFDAIRYYIQQNPVKAPIVSKASSFSSSQNTDAVPAQSKDALDTMLHQLFSFDEVNPFENNTEIQKQIILALDNTKILDPAAGSGAFPMGVLQKMVHVLYKVDPQNTEWKQRQIDKVNTAIETLEEIDDVKYREQSIKELKAQIKDIEDAFENNELDYGRKLFLIENCIYGVDIQSIAMQISKLRFFISLIVDQKIDRNKSNFGIRPLPNLETKFVAANTLIGIDKPDAQLSMFDNTEVKKLEAQLKKVRHKIFSSKSPKRKRELREEDKNLREQIALLLEEGGMENKTARQLASWDPYDQNASSPFFDPEWMFDIKEGFDVVIGNPPYILIQNIPNLSETYKNKYLDYFSAQYKVDLYHLFIEQGINLLTEKGSISYITPNTFIKNKHNNQLRNFIYKKCQIDSVILFYSQVFESVSVDNLIFVFTRSNVKSKSKIFEIKKSINDIKEPVRLYNEDLITGPDYVFNLDIDNEKEEIISQIEKGSSPLKDFGIQTYDRNSFVSNQIIDNSWKPVIDGGNVFRYKITDNVDFVKFTPESIKSGGNPEVYQKKRIVVRQIGRYPEGAYCPPDLFTLNTIYNIFLTSTTISLSFLLGQINSPVIRYHWLATNFDNKKTFPKIKKAPLEAIPIKRSLKHENLVKPLVDLCNTIYENQHIQSIKEVIDALIFSLHFPDHMKEREIDVLEFVERDIASVWPKHLASAQKQDAFDTLPDPEKEEVIEQLHQKWTDPDNEVVKRMGQFKEKSPDILGVILES